MKTYACSTIAVLIPLDAETAQKNCDLIGAFLAERAQKGYVLAHMTSIEAGNTVYHAFVFTEEVQVSTKLSGCPSFSQHRFAQELGS